MHRQLSIHAKTLFPFLLALFLAFTAMPVSGQKEKKKFKKRRCYPPERFAGSFSQSDIFDFPNVNKLREYSDPGKLKKIHQLDVAKQQELLYRALREYVSKFGIDNFSRNTPMIWKLAQLSRKYGQPGEAVLLYKLCVETFPTRDQHRRYLRAIRFHRT